MSLERLQRLPACSGLTKGRGKAVGRIAASVGGFDQKLLPVLLHNQDRLFLVRPFKGAAAADLPVLTIPWDRVNLIRVLAGYTSCE